MCPAPCTRCALLGCGPVGREAGAHLAEVPTCAGRCPSAEPHPGRPLNRMRGSRVGVAGQPLRSTLHVAVHPVYCRGSGNVQPHAAGLRASQGVDHSQCRSCARSGVCGHAEGGGGWGKRMLLVSYFLS